MNIMIFHLKLTKEVYLSCPSHLCYIPAMTRAFTLNMFQHIVAAVAATSFLRGQDFHDS
jgi:hypothetical protein